MRDDFRGLRPRTPSTFGSLAVARASVPSLRSVTPVREATGVLEPSAYGDAFADVYDDWYAGISDLEGTVDTVRRLAGGGPVLEIGVGTGRLAVPLVEAGVEVHGVDASEAMVE